MKQFVVTLSLQVDYKSVTLLNYNFLLLLLFLIFTCS